MANLYGPMTFKPNPGITLNSSPMQQFQAPAPVQAPAAASMPAIMSYREWMQDSMRNARGLRGGSMNGRRDGYNGPHRSSGMDPYDSYRLDVLSGMGGAGMPGRSSAPAATPGITLDSVAQAYARFLNGGQ